MPKFLPSSRPPIKRLESNECTECGDLKDGSHPIWCFECAESYKRGDQFNENIVPNEELGDTLPEDYPDDFDPSDVI